MTEDEFIAVAKNVIERCIKEGGITVNNEVYVMDHETLTNLLAGAMSVVANMVNELK